MTRILDGPAVGASLSLRRAPLFLRVVIDTSGGIDALDQPDDEPTEEEEVHVYRRVSPAAHVCVRTGKGRGCYEVADYMHVADADGEQVRDTAAWRTWAERQQVPA